MFRSSRSYVLSLALAIFHAPLPLVAAEQSPSFVVDDIQIMVFTLLVPPPNDLYGVVNENSKDCYCVAPPWGVRLMVHDRYLFEDARDTSEPIRKELEAFYPRCKIVKAVRNLTWPDDPMNPVP